MPDRLILMLSRKARWWMAVAFVLSVAIALIATAGIALDQREKIARIEAARVADARAQETAEDSAAVQSCLRGVYDVPDFLAALDGLAIVIDNQIDAANTALALDPDGPLAESRKRSLRRASRAQVGLTRLVSGEDGMGGIVRQRRTLRQCSALAARLGVKFDPLARQAADR